MWPFLVAHLVILPFPPVGHGLPVFPVHHLIPMGVLPGAAIGHPVWLGTLPGAVSP
ncbi:hypothetical protein [Sulfobacillus thermosulfidooxidans]|uniref:hypothetical protein n=1 Tax=Sulfobacillus thermosulfidooxidans TaxID=28034 RepID=UPI000AF1FE48|nr:hypothetical protein [Sulfobacillus thermosulfidooxidans]